MKDITKVIADWITGKRKREKLEGDILQADANLRESPFYDIQVFWRKEYHNLQAKYMTKYGNYFKHDRQKITWIQKD